MNLNDEFVYSSRSSFLVFSCKIDNEDAVANGIMIFLIRIAREAFINFEYQ